MKINAKRAAEVLRNTNGKQFGVTFTKRTTGELRDMRARINVDKYENGKGPVYNPDDYNLLFVFDMAKAHLGAGGYRAIPLDAVHSIRFQGQTYEVEND